MGWKEENREAKKGPAEFRCDKPPLNTYPFDWTKFVAHDAISQLLKINLSTIIPPIRRTHRCRLEILISWRFSRFHITFENGAMSKLGIHPGKDQQLHIWLWRNLEVHLREFLMVLFICRHSWVITTPAVRQEPSAVDPMSILTRDLLSSTQSL